MDTIFRRIKIYFFTCVLFSFVAIAQSDYKTIVKLTDLPNEALLQQMQKNATELLSEINKTFFFEKGSKPSVTTGVITEDARKVLDDLWETSPFRCYETIIIQRALQMHSKSEKKYQVRNIPVFVKNVFERKQSDIEADTDDNYQEICLTFNSSGLIENIFYSLESNIYTELMNEGIGVTDIRRRAFILEFIENFRTAYNRRDVDFLNKVFSDDALIITGKVIKAKSSDMLNSLSGAQIEYQKQTKKEYLEKLRNRIFKFNKHINILFEEIRITQDKVYKDIYGVNLKQDWNTSNYSDVGYLFLMVDFKDENNPIIHVRTWQPKEAKETKEGIFGLYSFDLEM